MNLPFSDPQRLRSAAPNTSESAPAQSAVAWQPLTPRGLAAFATARLSRLLLVQFTVAALAAAVTVEFLSADVFPAVTAAIRNLPDTGAIQSGRLDWMGPSPQVLAGGRFVAFIVDPDHTGQAQSAADLQIEFGRTTVRARSLFGYVEWHYPSGWQIAFNRTELEPLWGAWQPESLVIILLTVVLGLMLSWAALATIYFLPARLIGFLANRDVCLRGSWKLAGAALVPGALLFTAGIALYHWGALNPISLCLFFAAHLVVGWIYVVLGQFGLPRINRAAGKENPFKPAPPAG